MTKRAAIYCRISQDRTGAGLGVERQEQDCRALCERKGWAVVEVFTDNDVSAASGRRRPAYEAMLEGVRSGSLDVVVTWALDRLYRRPIELEELIPLTERHGVTLATIGGDHDLATRGGLLHARIMGAVAADETKAKSDRVKAAQAQAAHAGKWLGGAPPFGWKLEGNGSATLNRAEAREIREASKALLAGASLGSVVADLNARGVTTSTGRPWNYTSLRQVLTRPRNAGLSTLNGEIVGKTTWPPILTEETWRAVCALLSNPNRRRSTSNRVRWLLSGIAVCGACGNPLRSATVAKNSARGTTRTVYRCPTPGTGHVARSAEALDRHVEGVVLGLLARPDFAVVSGAVEGFDVEELRAEAVTIRASMEEAADLFAAGSITGAQLATITKRLQNRLDNAEAAMAQAARGSSLAPFVGREVSTVWAKLSVDLRRAVVRELMTVTVLASGKRGNGYDPALVKIEARRER